MSSRWDRNGFLGSRKQALDACAEELRIARLYAESKQMELKSFAVEVDKLYSLNCTSSDLRWLLVEGLIEHYLEEPHDGQAERNLVSSKSTRIQANSCFVLTDEGVQFVGNLSGQSNDVLHPKWDPSKRELFFGNQIVKRFRCPAPNQEAILMAFQEQGWQVCIDDPLPPSRGQDPKQRLHETIKSLNKRQLFKVIHFRGNGMGTGVCWEQQDGQD